MWNTLCPPSALRWCHLSLVMRCVSWKQKRNQSYLLTPSVSLCLLIGDSRLLIFKVIPDLCILIPVILLLSWCFISPPLIQCSEITDLFCFLKHLFYLLSSLKYEASSGGGSVVTYSLNLFVLRKLFLSFFNGTEVVSVVMVVSAGLCALPWFTEHWFRVF